MIFVLGQTLRHIFEIGVGIMPVQLGALIQTHDHSRTLACRQ